MIISFISFISSAVFWFVLNCQIYTDRAMMPNGQIREWHRSPISRLNIADQTWLVYLQLAAIAVSVISSTAILAGLKNSTVRIIQIVSAGLSVAVFIIIMIVTANTHAKYA